MALFVLGGTLHFNAISNLKYVVPSMTFKMVILPAVILAVATLLRLFRCGTFCLL